MSTPSTRPAQEAAGPAPRRLLILLALALWSILPPYLGPLVGLELDVSATVEVVDHVLPGALAAVAAGVALVLAGRGQGDSLASFVAFSACALAALFQTMTHIPLVRDAGGPLQPVDAVILHASPGPVLLLFSLWLLLRAPAQA